MTELLASLRAPLPRPEGPFRLLDERKAARAFDTARRIDRDLRARHGDLTGLEIVEVHPVILGGDPEAVDNKRAVDRETHDQLMAFWHREAPPRGELPPCDPAADLVDWAEEDEHVILRPNATNDVILRPLGAESPLPGLAVFATDGAGTAYTWGSGPLGEGVYELPAIPPDPRLARWVGNSLSDLLDARSR